MNIAQCERPERVFSSTGRSGLTSNNAKFFADPVLTESSHRKDFRVGAAQRMGADSLPDFDRFAFKALPVIEKEGLWLSSHLGKQDAEFDQAWAVYNEAFADFERRSHFEQMRVMAHPRYRFSAIRLDNDVLGALGYWDLPGFCFIEHFAVSSAHRSGGYGRRVIRLLQRHVQGPILLDVEPFGFDRDAARRVTFYARLGFHYCGKSVTLPPYEGKTTGPSNLMSWPMALDRESREQVVETIRREIYGLSAFAPHHHAV